ncbi:hypothetical protein D9619_010732 [Psilocybe cf. subviscida]|uniref:FHA domain-containing protein n=1 Tax=Psilocybe cf. subviscida TaxID=2480587 RepID=A0A8H5BAN8_9AGAR|nr:hypothetical protein D9619_010732 [Psilocybe cf. subviscida]
MPLTMPFIYNLMALHEEFSSTLMLDSLYRLIGAAIAGIAGSVPSWNNSYAGGNVGGLLNAILAPAGGFGKLLTVILSLSVAANLASIFYTASLNFQVIIPRLVVVPRYVFTLVTAAIVLPISIIGAHRFYTAISNLLSLLGYWASVFVSVLLIEHLVFRSNTFANYDTEAWNIPGRLPSGLAAIGCGFLTFGLVVPSISQVWFTGPIARTTGDLGFEVALVLSRILIPELLVRRRFTGEYTHVYAMSVVLFFRNLMKNHPPRTIPTVVFRFTMSINLSMSASVGSFPFKTKSLSLATTGRVILGSTETSSSKEAPHVPSSSNGWFSPVPAADRSQPNISPLPLSSSHAELSFKNGKVYIKDLDSAFGTFVNGSRISGETQLNSGDILSLGSPIPRNDKTPVYITNLHLVPVIAKVVLS